LEKSIGNQIVFEKGYAYFDRFVKTFRTDFWLCVGVGQPKTLTNCKILIANTPMDTDKIKIYGARVKVDSFEAVKEIEDAERRKMSEKVMTYMIFAQWLYYCIQVDKIAAHGCNVFINRQLIYNYPDQLFKDKGNIIKASKSSVSNIFSSRYYGY
jgi:chaperonin GroEL (HSP60 family)